MILPFQPAHSLTESELSEIERAYESLLNSVEALDKHATDTDPDKKWVKLACSVSEDAQAALGGLDYMIRLARKRLL